MEQVTFDTNGTQYIFAYFVRAEENKEDGVDRWRIPPHRFQLGNTCSSATMGQFITTNWWSRTRPIGEKREFMIKNPAFSNINAVINDRFVTLEYVEATPGPRNIRAVKKLVDAFWPK